MNMKEILRLYRKMNIWLTLVVLNVVISCVITFIRVFNFQAGSTMDNCYFVAISSDIWIMLWLIPCAIYDRKIDKEIKEK